MALNMNGTKPHEVVLRRIKFYLKAGKKFWWVKLEELEDILLIIDIPQDEIKEVKKELESMLTECSFPGDEHKEKLQKITEEFSRKM
jgi:predicted DNA-binding ArsR family transcriptional regulator